MNITISPFTISSDTEFKLSLFKINKKEPKKPIVYWGIYLNNKQISYTTSSKQLAEKTKLWMENWLKDKS